MNGCRTQPYVLPAVIAISALSVSRKLNREAKDGASRAAALRYKQLALKQHEKSLQAMRETLGKQPDVRRALGACLMVCFFECLSGNLLTTFSHARSVSSSRTTVLKISCGAPVQLVRRNLPTLEDLITSPRSPSDIYANAEPITGTKAIPRMLEAH
jgi:hypothetical protein